MARNLTSTNGEIIEFHTPKDEQHTLFVTNVHSEANSLELKQIFAPFGLLHNVILLKETENTPGFAIIKYYSTRATFNALVQVNGAILHGLKIGVRPGRKGESRGKDGFRVELAHNKVVQLANYYLGFNQWMCSIKELKPFGELETTERNNFKSTYKCVVQLHFRQTQQTVEAEGKGIAVDKSKVHAMERAMKNATSDARKKAFSMVRIMVFNSGRAVPMLPDQLRPQEPPKKIELPDNANIIDVLFSTMDWSKCEEKEMPEDTFKLTEDVGSDSEDVDMQ